MRMIHIVFQPKDARTLREVMQLDPALAGEVLTFADDFAVGPIQALDSPEGAGVRRQWWREVLAGGDYDGRVDNGEGPDDAAVLRQLREFMQAAPELEAWIWVAQNPHDLSGYYWLLGQIRDLTGRVFLLHLNNLPFLNARGAIFFPRWLFEIPLREFLKAKKLARAITSAEWETDPDEWVRLGLENRGIRLLEGGKKLRQESYDYFDSDLRQFIGLDWTKAAKIIHQYLTRATNATGDAFLLWRLKQMILGEGYEVQGKIAQMKEFEVRRRVQETASDLSTNPPES